MALGAGQRGAKAVLVWDLVEATAQAVAKEIEHGSGGVARAVKVEVTSQESVDAAAEQARAEFGRVDILINNAGIVTGKDVVEVTQEDVERTFSVNTTSHYRTTKAFLPGMFDGVTTKFDWILPILREPMRSAMGRRAGAWR